MNFHNQCKTLIEKCQHLKHSQLHLICAQYSGVQDPHLSDSEITRLLIENGITLHQLHKIKSLNGSPSSAWPSVREELKWSVDHQGNCNYYCPSPMSWYGMAKVLLIHFIKLFLKWQSLEKTQISWCSHNVGKEEGFVQGNLDSCGLVNAKFYSCTQEIVSTNSKLFKKNRGWKVKSYQSKLVVTKCIMKNTCIERE